MNLINLISDEVDYQSHSGKIFGVVIGVVTNNEDPDGLHRVKVRFPWLSDEEESHWARVVSLMGGKDRGSYFLPEVDDEVLIAFDKGNTQIPYVIGSLWNGVDSAPYDNSNGQNNLRVIKSRSGHELIFDDNDSQKKERVELHTKAGHKIILDDSAGKEKVTIEDKTGSNSIVIDSVKNSISIESAMKLSIKSQMIDIEAGTMMNIKAGATLKIQGALVQIN